MTPAVRLLDLTRLVSRLGRGPMTGVDRVEYAYLGHLLSLGAPVLGLVRSALGYLLLDRSGLLTLHSDEVKPGDNDLLGRLTQRRNPMRAKAEAAIRRLAIARCPRWGLAPMLRRSLPSGGWYLNTGHSNLDEHTLKAIHRAGMQIAVLVHDTIPLDSPQFARPDTVVPFARKLRAVARQADIVIHTSRDACARTQAQFERLAGRVPPGLVVPLGVPTPVPQPSDLPFAPHSPYFVCLGTIEPRKNHALLLDVWSQLPEPVPHLYIVGSRGWSNAAVFARLDGMPRTGAVHEVSGLSDGAVAHLLLGAQALLFPSHAEGYGLPALEAAALGVPVIVSDLAVFRELLRDFAVYLDPADSYSWLEAIKRLAGLERERSNRLAPPQWQEHFNIVLSRL